MRGGALTSEATSMPRAGDIAVCALIREALTTSGDIIPAPAAQLNATATRRSAL